MSTKRWRVKCGRGNRKGRFYVYGPGVFRDFTDWREALAYAMRMSRTVEVELPKVEDVHEIVSASLALGVVRAPSGDAFLSAGGRDFDIWKQEFKPLGEYLLALHYHYERNKK